MKYIKLLTFLGICTLVMLRNYSCNETPSKKIEPNNEEQTASYQKLLLLTAQYNCNTCHALNEKLTGPSFKEIAKKYEKNDENIELLTSKVINGSVGVWGKIPMIEHKNLSPIDAKKMINYILLLRDE